MVKRCFRAAGARFLTVTSTLSSKGASPSGDHLLDRGVGVLVGERAALAVASGGELPVEVVVGDLLRGRIGAGRPQIDPQRRAARLGRADQVGGVGGALAVAREEVLDGAERIRRHHARARVVLQLHAPQRRAAGGQLGLEARAVDGAGLLLRLRGDGRRLIVEVRLDGRPLVGEEPRPADRHEEVNRQPEEQPLGDATAFHESFREAGRYPSRAASGGCLWPRRRRKIWVGGRCGLGGGGLPGQDGRAGGPRATNLGGMARGASGRGRRGSSGLLGGLPRRRRRVVTTRMERVALTQAPDRKQGPADGAVALEAGDCVPRARRLEPAHRPEEREEQAR